MAPRTGRPPSDNPRRHMVTVRLTDAEYATVRSAASVAGLRLGEWTRARLLAAARRKAR